MSQWRAVGALVLDSRWRVYLSERINPTNARGKGLYSGPGGLCEPGESQEAALLRELREEAGLVVEPSRLTYYHHGELQPLSGLAPSAHEVNVEVISTQYLLKLYPHEVLAHSEPHKHGPWRPYGLYDALQLPLVPVVHEALQKLYTTVGSW